MRDVQEGDRQITASAVILSTEQPARVLLVHHKKFQTWLQPGGHVERNELPFEGAIREAREETGIDISPYLLSHKHEKVDEYAWILPNPQWVMEQEIPPHNGQPKHYHVDHLYVVHVPWQEPVLDAKEAHDIGWFTLQETEKLPLFENTRYILSEVLR